MEFALPIAVLISRSGDTRDADGLFLAGRGWTTVPVTPASAQVHDAVRALAPAVVVIDCRGIEEAAEACLRVLADLETAIYVLHRAVTTVPLPANARAAIEPVDIPFAPGVPAAPHGD